MAGEKPPILGGPNNDALGDDPTMLLLVRAMKCSKTTPKQMLDIIEGWSQIFGDFNGVAGDASRIEGNVTHIKGDVSNLCGDVTYLKGNVSGLSGDVTNVWGVATGVEGDMTDLGGELQRIFA
jgi:hypothetical protein